MFKAFLNIFRVPELRNKLLFTMGMLVIYRIGFWIPLPAVDQVQLQEWAQNQTGAAGNLLTFMSIFTGGSLGQSTLFGLGIMPYISAAIIIQLLTTVSEKLKALQKEGASGRQKIQEYTRYLTVALCIVQATFWLGFMQRQGLVYADFREGAPAMLFWFCGLVGLTAGTTFLMWLGEQIDKYGIGNGASLIITAGIVASMPGAIGEIVTQWDAAGAMGGGGYGPAKVIFLLISFIVVVSGAILITQGQRRIPIQQGKHQRGQRMYGGQRTYLPLRVNHGGVMPIIFASSLMIFPSVILGYLGGPGGSPFFAWLNTEMAPDAFLYVFVYIILIYFFAYFWTTVQFQPKEMATNLRDHGSFIPGMRPGPRTAEYLETVMERITYAGAGFLAVIAVIPTLVSGAFDVSYRVTQFLGGTGLLIVVSVMLDFIQRVEASLLMRNYQGFLSSSGKKGPRIRGTRGGAI